MADEKDPTAKDQEPSVSGSTVDPKRGGPDAAGQEKGQGQKDAPKHGDKERPSGTSDTSDVTGVDPKKIITRDSPAG